MSVLAEPLNLGDLLKYEAPNLYSRDRVTVASGQNLPLGTVLGIVTASGKYKQIDPSAEDGTQVAAGVLLQACDATLIDRDDGLVVARHAERGGDRLPITGLIKVLTPYRITVEGPGRPMPPSPRIAPPGPECACVEAGAALTALHDAT